MSAIVQTIKGSQAFTASALSDTTVGATSAVDIDNCVVMYTTRNADTQTRAKRYQFIAELATVSTNVVIQWSRHEDGGDGGTLEWTVIEFESASLGTQGIEAGTITNTTSNTTDTVNLAGVNTPTNSLILTSGTTDNNSFVFTNAPVVFSTNVTLGDQLTFDYHSTSGANDWQMGWQTIELLSADVSAEHGDNAFTDNESFTGFTAVTTLADSHVLQTGQSGGNTSAVRYMTRLEMTSASNIEFDDSTIGSGQTNNVSWSVIEWLSDVTVEKGTVTITDTNASPTAPTFTALTFDQTAVMVGSTGANNGYQSGASDGAIDDAWASIELDDPADSLTIVRTGTTEQMEYAWNVVEFPLAGGGPETYNEAMTLGGTFTASAAGPLTIPGALTLGVTADLTAANDLSLVVAMDLDSVIGLTAASTNTLGAGITLASTLSLDPAAVMTAVADISLGLVGAVSPAATLDMPASMTLGASVGLTNVSSFAITGAITLATTVGLTKVSQLDAAASLALGYSVGLSSAATADLVGTAALDLTCTVSQGAAGSTYNAPITLAVTGTVAFGPQADLVATVDFDITLQDSGASSVPSANDVAMTLGASFGIQATASFLWGSDGSVEVTWDDEVGVTDIWSPESGKSGSWTPDS